MTREFFDAMGVDNEARPAKKLKLVHEITPTIVPEAMLPLPVLLLSLPNLLLHPPTHRNFFKSMSLSRLAFQRCLQMQNLDADMECKAWTGLAEIGLRYGLHIEGVEHEVEKAVTKALLIAQNHPALRPYKVHLTLLSARLSQHQLNHKFSQNTLRRLLSTFFSPNDPPYLVYSSHLGYISSLGGQDSDGSPVPNMKSMAAIQDLYTAGMNRGHSDIVKLAVLLRLQTHIQMGSIDMVGDALAQMEQLLMFPDQDTLVQSELTFARLPRSNNDTAFLVYTLILGVMYYTHIGNMAATDVRTKVLHDMLDRKALAAFGECGILQISFPGSHPLYIRTAHPRVMYALGYLITAIAKRDPVGRKPKRKVFAAEGLAVVEKELKKEIALPMWASEMDVLEQRSRLQKLKADMMCEIIGVCIMRSEFGEAERTMAELIAHTRNEELFNYYSPRITLLQGQLAHALGFPDRAIQCYQVAAYLSRRRDGKPSPDDEGTEDQWTHATASAGELWVRVGLMRMRFAHEGDETYLKQQEEELKKVAEDVISACEGIGGTLGAVACILKACLTAEYLKAKIHLREALKIVTASTDNHLRALILALIASQYLNTSTEHATQMLATAEQLAAGLGAQPRPNKDAASQSQQGKPAKIGDGVGNAPLRLWIGERNLELKRRAGDDSAAQDQEIMNVKLRVAMAKLEQRKSFFLHGAPLPGPPSAPIHQSAVASARPAPPLHSAAVPPVNVGPTR